MREVSFGEFQTLARSRGWTADFLTERFRGAFGERGDVRDLFERVFQGRYAANVIPYASVIRFFEQELAFHQAEMGNERRCECGCGQRVFDRRRWASETCRKRVQRRRIRDAANLPEKPLNLLAPTRDISGGCVPAPHVPVSSENDAPEAA